MKIAQICFLSLVLLASSTDAQTLYHWVDKDGKVYRWVDKDGKVYYSDQPPPKEIKKVDRPRLGTSTIETSGLPYEAQKAAQDFPVTLFTSADCKAECDSAREFLSRRGVPYRETRIVTVADGEAFKQAMKTDKLLLPALTVGSQQQLGFEEGTWNGLLNAAGYPRSAIPGAATGNAPTPSGR